MNLLTVDYTAPDAPLQFVESLREFGFAVLANHPLKAEGLAQIYQAWQDFFNSPTKYHYRFSPRFDGYFPPDVSETAKGHQVKDLKEYFHFYYPWGQCPPELLDITVQYRQQANQIAEQLLNWIEQYSPPEVAAHYSEPLSAMIKGSDQTLLRVLHYPPLKGDEEPDAIRAAAHEDINFLTILPAANQPGLQVLTKENQWLDVPCDFGLLIINIGDMLQEASNGYFPSTTHRVINPPEQERNKSRLSLPLFLHPRPEVVLSPRHTAHSYLQERLKELGF